MTGIGAGTISSVEKGRNSPDPYTRMALERALEQHINWLTTRGFEHVKDEIRSWEDVELTFRRAVLRILSLNGWKQQREFLTIAKQYLDDLEEEI